MALLILAVKSKIKWIAEAGETPFFGGIFLFLLMFIPAVLLSFLTQQFIPGLHDDIGFTKAILVFLPSWNLFLWVKQTKLFLFYLPAWMLLGGIAIIKAILLLTGNEA